MEHYRLEFLNRRGLFAIGFLALAMLSLTRGAPNAEAQSAGLWIANENSPTLSEFQGRLNSGSKKPAGLIDDSNDLDGASTIAFDQNDNLWVTNFNANSITEFAESEWQADAPEKRSHPSAAITISEDAGQNLDGPEGIIFDSAQNMWIGAEDGKVVLMYTPSQYAASGNPTPSVILNANSFQFSSPSHLAFDSSGNLWVVDENRSNGQGGHGEIFRYDVDQIATLGTGNQNVDPVFGIALQGFVHLETIAFDAGGNLWEADQQGNVVYKFAASDLTGTGLSQNLTPAVVLSATHRGGSCKMTLDGPYGLAIDGSGDLFVANSNVHGGCRGSLAEFSASSIESTGSPKPEVFITTDGKHNSIDAPNALTFGPTL